LPPVTDAIEVTEIAKKMLQSAGYIIYFITEVRPIDTRLWQVRAITYPLTIMRIRIAGENGQVVEFINEYSPQETQPETRWKT
jgi:hypothetical protein